MVLRLVPLAAFALASTLGAQDPVYVPAKKPTTTSAKAPVTVTKQQDPTTKQGTTTKPAPATSTKEPGTSAKAPTKQGGNTVPAKAVPLPGQASTTKQAPAVVPARRGWLGFRTDPNDSEVILEVAPDSPAERAGIRPGDRIVSADRLLYSVSKADSTSGRPGPSRYYVSGPIMGATYRMTLARGAETFDVSMVAVAPPASQRPLLRPTLAPGSAPDTLAAEVEAFRTELARTTLQPSRRAPATPLRRFDELRTRADSEAARRPELDEALTIRDSALYAMLERTVNGRLTGDSGIISDPELYNDLSARIRQVDLLASTLDRRPNAISGAEFEQLNPALGQYFGGISEGVFVLRVGAESPAATAGLEPGDIVQSVNGERVATIEGMRERVARATGTITLQVIRKGRPATVRLRKE